MSITVSVKYFIRYSIDSRPGAELEQGLFLNDSATEEKEDEGKERIKLEGIAAMDVVSRERVKFKEKGEWTIFPRAGTRWSDSQLGSCPSHRIRFLFIHFL